MTDGVVKLLDENNYGEKTFPDDKMLDGIPLRDDTNIPKIYLQMNQRMVDLVVFCDHGLLAHLIEDPTTSQSSHLVIQNRQLFRSLMDVMI